MTDATAHPIRIRDHPDFQGVSIVELTVSSVVFRGRKISFPQLEYFSSITYFQTPSC